MIKVLRSSAVVWQPRLRLQRKELRGLRGAYGGLSGADGGTGG